MVVTYDHHFTSKYMQLCKDTMKDNMKRCWLLLLYYYSPPGAE